MSLGRSSRFCFFGLAKVKSKKVLSSFASASSITIHHGSKLCYRTLDTDVGKTLMNVENAQVLESTHKRYVLSSALAGFAPDFLGYAITTPTVNSLFIVGFFPSYQNHSQHLHFVPSLHRQCAILPRVSSISGDKQIHPLRCLQQGNPHDPSPSMPFY